MLAMAMGGCHLSDGEIERYSMGRSPDAELDRCDEHLLICGPCRRLVERADVFVCAMRRAAALSPERPRIRRGWFHLPQLIPVLAALAALLIAVWLRSHYPVPLPPTATVLLTASRGPGIQIHAPAGTPLVLQPDLSGLPVWPSYRLEVVDAAGARLWEGRYPGAAAPKMRPGVYFVRLYSPAGELYREYGLEIPKPR
jgi:hypothetical protein